MPVIALYLHKFSGEGDGRDDGWQARIKAEIRDSNGDRVRSPIIVLAWDGANAATEAFEANKDGKINVRINGFTDDRVTFSVVNVILDGYTYQPALNSAPASIVIENPG